MNILTEENMVKLKLGLYGGLLFFSFFPIIAVPITQNNRNACVLYYTFPDGFGPDSNCNYAVAMAVIFQLLYGIFRIALLVLLMLGKLTTEFVLLSDLFQLVYTVVDTVAWFLVFISACILSAGINKSCSYGICSAWLKDDATRIHTAEAGAWISFILWLVLVVSGVFMLFRQGKIPFLSRPAAGDGGAAGATGPSPTMDTPPAAAEEPKY